MTALAHLRDMIATLDIALTDELCARAERPYPLTQLKSCSLDTLAAAFAQASTLTERSQLLRPLFHDAILPPLCLIASGLPTPSNTPCLKALARRLALSTHVALRKHEALPAALQEALQTRDPVRIEAAITHPQIEAEVITRVETRAQKLAAPPETIRRITTLYTATLIPLSRKIQVHALLAHQERI